MSERKKALPDLVVEDADGHPIGHLAPVDPAQLARHVPVRLDPDAKQELHVARAEIDLPAALIRRRRSDAVELSRNLASLRDLLTKLDTLDELAD